MQLRHLALAMLLAAAAHLCLAQTPAKEILDDLIAEAVADVAGKAERVDASTLTPPEIDPEALLSTLAAAAPSPMPEDGMRRLLLQASAEAAPKAEAEIGAGVRKLLGTLTVNASRGDLWAYQRKATTEVTRDPEGGKASAGRAVGSAFAANGRDCLREDCEKPIAQVETKVVPGTATAGPQASADAYAKGRLVSATRTKTTSIDTARQGDTWAVGVARGDSYSLKKGGEESRSTSGVQATAFVIDGTATFFGAGTATSGPYGEKPWSQSRVDVWGRVSTPGYGYGR